MRYTTLKELLQSDRVVFYFGETRLSLEKEDLRWILKETSNASNPSMKGKKKTYYRPNVTHQNGVYFLREELFKNYDMVTSR